MYHIKDDLRAQKSAKLIYEGLSLCMQTKPFNHITISDIQKISSVGRSTFYRNFDTLYDVLYWQCDQRFAEISTLFLTEDAYQKEAHGLLRLFFNYWSKHSLLLEQILSIHRIDMIYECHMKNSFAITEYFGRIYTIPGYHYEYFMGIRSGIFISILLIWIKRGKKESFEELFDMLSLEINRLHNPPTSP